MNNPLTSGEVYQQMMQRYTHHIHTYSFKHALRAQMGFKRDNS